MGFTNPTEVQEKVIPVIMGGKEVIARSKTGSGKTSAFGISIMELLAAGKVRKALIIAPVRELALQIMEELRALGKYHRYRVICAYGGQNIDVQIKMIYNGVDILVATPGRLLDLFERGTIDLNEYDFVVLDEADKMFEMGFIEDIDVIVSNTSYARRVQLFSATISEDVQRIASKYMKAYEMVEVGEQEKPPQIEEEKITLERPEKFNKLVEIIQAQRQANATGKILIFVATQRATEYVGKRLQAMGIDCSFIHGDIRQNRRERIMGSFKEGRSNILVATDVAARGLHIDDIALVINYDEANDSQTHMHRIGRTGRMGASGKAITFVDKNPYFGRPVRSGFRPKVGPYNPYAGGERRGPRGPYSGSGGHGGGRPYGGGGHGGGGSHGGAYGGYSHGPRREGGHHGGGHSGGHSGSQGGHPGQHRPRRTHRFTRR
ncbi:putative ATP-dependent RNA helicase [uncultured archaeon]|nr:putative ATP-dependent RNA helicase [uncultured archaeon]